MQRTALQTPTGGNASLAAGGGALSGALEGSIAGTGAHVKAVVVWPRSVGPSVRRLAVTCGESAAVHLYRNAGFVDEENLSPFAPVLSWSLRTCTSLSRLPLMTVGLTSVGADKRFAELRAAQPRALI